MSRPVIIDTDPGQDDAVAILLALASDELEVLGITTVAGNVPLPLTTRNALKMVELAGRVDVPVYAGCPRPMVRRLHTAEYVHGPTGLDGTDLPDPVTLPHPTHAVDFLIETLSSAQDAQVTLCPIGPLTNVAMAMVMDPGVTRGIREIVLMGGGFSEGGNTTPAAEFNVFVDPHAAEVVFSSGVPITMMPLDVTHRVLTTRARIAAFRDLGTPVGAVVAGMLDYFDRYDEAKYGTEGGPLHDPCTIAYLLRPDLFRGKACNVQIVTEGPAAGMTMVDWWRVTGLEPNATVMRNVDADGFFDLLTERVALL